MDGKKVKLRLEHISQSYIVKNEVSDAVVDVSLDVYDNEFLVILGPGRCGKTVLLNMIAGLEKPVDGSLFLDGEEIHGSDERIGMVFQKLALMPWKTVMENVEFGLKMKGVPKAQRRETAQKYINLVGLQGFEKSYPSQLSGGQQQRAALARMLASRPALILLDEPFSALDAYLKEQLLLELLELLKDYSGDVILVTHSRDEAYKICPELMIVREGRQMEKGSTRALFQNPEYLETARMTGCKNLLKARKCGPNKMELTELGIRLVSEQPVLDDVRYAGIRAHYFYVPADPAKEVNLLHPLDFQETEAPFEINVIFHTKAGAPGIWWKLEKETWNSLGRKMPPALALAPKDVLPLR